MVYYFIEFRFFGKARRELKSLVCNVNKRFGIKNKRRHVPHITIISPFTANNEKKLINDFREICSKQKLLFFKVKGYGHFESTRVVFVNITPDKGFIEFRAELLKRLSHYCKLNKTDAFSFLFLKFYKKWYPHAAIALHLTPDKFKKIKDHFENQKGLDYPHHLIRATLMRNDHILAEYDFLLKKLLTRREAKNVKVLRQTFGILKDEVERRRKV